MTIDLTGNLLMDKAEKNESRMNSVAIEWDRLTGGGVVRAHLGESRGDWALELAGGGAWPFARAETKWMGSSGNPTDAFSSLTSQRERFDREMAMLAAEHPAAFVGIEGKASDLATYTSPGGMTWGGNILPSILDLSFKHRMPFLFTDRLAEWLSIYFEVAPMVPSVDKHFPPPENRTPRRIIVAKSLEELFSKMAGRCGPGANFVMPFALPPPRKWASDLSSARRLMRSMIRHRWCFWFLDGHSPEQFGQVVARMEELEGRYCAMAAAGGPAAPPKTDPDVDGSAAYTGKLPRLGKWKPASGYRSRRTIVVFTEGPRPLFLYLKRCAGGVHFSICKTEGDPNLINSVTNADRLVELYSHGPEDGVSEKNRYPLMLAKLRELAGLNEPEPETEPNPFGDVTEERGETRPEAPPAAEDVTEDEIDDDPFGLEREDPKPAKPFVDPRPAGVFKRPGAAAAPSPAAAPPAPSPEPAAASGLGVAEEDEKPLRQPTPELIKRLSDLYSSPRYQHSKFNVQVLVQLTRIADALERAYPKPETEN